MRCVPPKNLPVPAEVATCNPFLAAELHGLPNLRIAMALGTLSHAAIIRALGLRQAAFSFRHGALHELPSGLLLADSYHVSRYNTSTRRLTTEMFEDVIKAITEKLAS